MHKYLLVSLLDPEPNPQIRAPLRLEILTFGFRDRRQILGPRLALFDLGILVLTTGLVIYCRALVSRESCAEGRPPETAV